jgi:hypothetical protein
LHRHAGIPASRVFPTISLLPNGLGQGLAQSPAPCQDFRLSHVSAKVAGVHPLDFRHLVKMAVSAEDARNGIVPALTVDEDDAWSEQDLHDLSVFALQHALSATDEGSISG